MFVSTIFTRQHFFLTLRVARLIQNPETKIFVETFSVLMCDKIINRIESSNAALAALTIRERRGFLFPVHIKNVKATSRKPQESFMLNKIIRKYIF